MVVIRLSRQGAKNRPFYKIVVADKRCPRDGRCIERIGHFNPSAAGKDIALHMESERVQYWLSKGAQPSDVVGRLIKKYDQAAAQATTAQ